MFGVMLSTTDPWELLLLLTEPTDDDVDDARAELSARKPSALTGGAFKTPTPLPSVTNDTWDS